MTSLADLQGILPDLQAALKPNGIRRIAYPKGTSKMDTDLNRDIILELANRWL